ncbi:hypothetical protein RhiirA5_447119, partial [Rhizophagus irregularis]
VKRYTYIEYLCFTTICDTNNSTVPFCNLKNNKSVAPQCTKRNTYKDWTEDETVEPKDYI